MKITLIIFTLFIFKYSVGQSNKYSIEALNKLLHNSAINFNPCENVTMKSSDIIHKTCKGMFSNLPIKTLLITGGTDINTVTKTLYYYVELTCPNDNGCIVQTGLPEIYHIAGIRYSFPTKPDAEKAFKILTYLKKAR